MEKEMRMNLFDLMGLAFLALIIYALYKQLSSHPERKDVKREMIETKGFKLNYLGGHPKLMSNTSTKVMLFDENTIGLYSTDRLDCHQERINICDVKYCGIKTAQQVMNDASLGRTLVWGTSALKDSVETVNYLILTYLYEDVEITCMFEGIESSTCNFELNKLINIYNSKKLVKETPVTN
jgi:hypothetical protein